MKNSRLYYFENSESVSYIHIYCQEKEILTLTYGHLCITSGDVIATGFKLSEDAKDWDSSH